MKKPLKKFILIGSLVMITFMFGIPVSAKSPARKGTTKTHQTSGRSQNTDFGPSVFFKKDGDLKRDIPKTLSSMGFKKSAKNKWSNEGFTIEDDSYGSYIIYFPNQYALKKFMKELNEANFGNQQDEDYFETQYGIQCVVDGLTITIQALP